MYTWDRETQPELELYTLTNLNSGEEFIVTMDDMKNSIHSELDIIKMLNLRHNDFMLVPMFDNQFKKDYNIATNF